MTATHMQSLTWLMGCSNGCQADLHCRAHGVIDWPLAAVDILTQLISTSG
jgi:hypothetical protein